MSEDYDYYDSIEYTQEDLATIDAIAAAYFDPPLPQGCPEVRIELEGPLQPHESTPSTSRDSSEPSPIQTYRRNRVLTVTDLVSPMWFVYTAMVVGVTRLHTSFQVRGSIRLWSASGSVKTIGSASQIVCVCVREGNFRREEGRSGK